jgi:hypothetical protein
MLSSAVKGNLHGCFVGDIPCGNKEESLPIDLLLRHLECSGGDEPCLSIPIRAVLEWQDPSDGDAAVADYNLFSLLDVPEEAAELILEFPDVDRSHSGRLLELS